MRAALAVALLCAASASLASDGDGPRRVFLAIGSGDWGSWADTIPVRFDDGFHHGGWGDDGHRAATEPQEAAGELSALHKFLARLNAGIPPRLRVTLDLNGADSGIPPDQLHTLQRLDLDLTRYLDKREPAAGLSSSEPAAGGGIEAAGLAAEAHRAALVAALEEHNFVAVHWRACDHRASAEERRMLLGELARTIAWVRDRVPGLHFLAPKELAQVWGVGVRIQGLRLHNAARVRGKD